jgi:hypothetical protein
MAFAAFLVQPDPTRAGVAILNAHIDDNESQRGNERNRVGLQW